MAPDDGERRGRRRWFRKSDAPDAPAAEHDAGAVDVITEAPTDGAKAVPANQPAVVDESPAPTPEPEITPEAVAAEPRPDAEPAPAGVADETFPEPSVPAEPDPVPESTSTTEAEAPTAPPGNPPVTDAPAVDVPTGLGDVPAGDDRPEPITLPRVLAIANQKGGVGKTTTAVNLGAALAELGFRVLVVDLDPQGNATTGLGISHRNVEGSIYDVIMNDVPIEDCIEPTTVRNLFVVPATIDLAGAEIELVPAFSRELKLRRAIQSARDEYDFVLIDCPPSLGLLTVNGLAAADDVIVPIQCEYYALEGLGQLLRNLNLVKSNLNPPLDLRGIVLTMYDARTKLAEQVENEVRAHFGSKVYRTVVPRTVRISEAPSFGQPVTVFDSSSRGALAYRELAKEVSDGATGRPR